MVKRYTFVDIDGLGPTEVAQHWRETPDGKWVLAEDAIALERVAIALRDTLHNLVTGSSGKSRGKEWDDAELALSQASSLPDGEK
jgi:hypothetical protein